MMHYNIAVLLLILFHGNKVHLSDIMDINDKICLPETTVCNNTASSAGNNNDTYYESIVDITCPLDHTIIITDVMMELYLDIDQCTHLTNYTCLLKENDIPEKELVTFIKHSMCSGKQRCTSRVSYKVPDVGILQSYCRSNISMVIPVLRIKYKCYKYCRSANPLQLYVGYWHTMDKTCTGNVTRSRLYFVHILVSHYQMVNIMLKVLTNGVPLESLNEEIAATATANINGACLIEFESYSSFVMGTYRVISSIMTVFPPNGKKVVPCEQRLIIQSDFGKTILCSNNISAYSVKINTGHLGTKYWVWYESDDAAIKVVFYLIMEVVTGKATVACGYRLCTNPLVLGQPQTTDSSEVTTVTDGATSTITHTTELPNNLIIIISVVTVCGVVVILTIVVIIIILKYNKRTHTQSQVDNVDNASIYDEINETGIETEYNEIVDNDKIMDTYLTQNEKSETLNGIPNVYLSHPNILLDGKAKETTVTDVSNQYFSPQKRSLDEESEICDVYLSQLDTDGGISSNQVAENTCNSEDIYLKPNSKQADDLNVITTDSEIQNNIIQDAGDVNIVNCIHSNIKTPGNIKDDYRNYDGETKLENLSGNIINVDNVRKQMNDNPETVDDKIINNLDSACYTNTDHPSDLETCSEENDPYLMPKSQNKEIDGVRNIDNAEQIDALNEQDNNSHLAANGNIQVHEYNEYDNASFVTQEMLQDNTNISCHGNSEDNEDPYLTPAILQNKACIHGNYDDADPYMKAEASENITSQTFGQIIDPPNDSKQSRENTDNINRSPESTSEEKVDIINLPVQSSSAESINKTNDQSYEVENTNTNHPVQSTFVEITDILNHQSNLTSAENKSGPTSVENTDINHQSDHTSVENTDINHQSDLTSVENTDINHQSDPTSVENTDINHQSDPTSVENTDINHQSNPTSVENTDINHQSDLTSVENTDINHQSDPTSVENTDDINHPSGLTSVENTDSNHLSDSTSVENTEMNHQSDPTSVENIDIINQPVKSTFEETDNIMNHDKQSTFGENIL